MTRSQSARRARETDETISSSGALGKRIRAARRARGLTLAQVAGDDFSPSFLSLVEQGKSGVSLRSLEAIARRLELPVASLLEDVGPPGTTHLTLSRAEAELLSGKPERCLERLEGVAGGTSELQILVLRGRALDALDRPQEALSAFQRALILADEGKDSAAADLRCRIALCLAGLGSPEESAVYARRALEDSQAGPENPTLIAQILIALGRALSLGGDAAGALEQYRRAVGSGDAFPTLRALGALYADLSLRHERQGDMEEAARYADLSVVALRAHAESRVLAEGLVVLANECLKEGTLDEALYAAERALERARQLAESELEAKAQSALAAAHLRSGNLDAAADAAEAAQQLAPGASVAAGIDACVVLAEVAERRGRQEDADQLYQRALSSLQPIDRKRYANVCIAYSDLLQRRGDTETALRFALMAARSAAS